MMPNSVSSCTGSDAALRSRTCGMSGDNSLPVSASQTAWRWASIRSRLASSIACSDGEPALPLWRPSPSGRFGVLKTGKEFDPAMAMGQAIAERREFAALLRDMKGLVRMVDGDE